MFSYYLPKCSCSSQERRKNRSKNKTVPRNTPFLSARMADSHSAQMNKYFMYFNFLIYEPDVLSLSLLYFATS